MIVFDNLTDPTQILEAVIKNGIKHEYYNETVELAEKYMAYTTGNGMDAMLRQFVRREDDVMFEQRTEITSHIIPSVYSQIRKVFNKVPRTNAIHFDYDTNKKDDLEINLNTFKGTKTLDGYLSNRFVELSFTDPNAFIVTDFESTDGVTYAKPYPLEVYSKNAIYFKEDKGNLIYLIGQFTTNTTVIINNEVKEIDLDRFVYWDKDRAVVFQEVLEKVITEDQTFVTINEKHYEIIEPLAYNLDNVPAIRVGYEMDQESNGAFYVNPMNAAEPYIKKTIKTVSEMDLTMALHTFPQKLQYLPQCTEKGCDRGILPDGDTCSACGGTGVMKVATTTQDAITLRMPTTDDQAITPINSLVAYLSPDVSLVEFQKQYIEYLCTEIRKTIFQTDTYTQAEVSQTATESNLNMQGVYDTLYPFAIQYCEVKEQVIKNIAGIMDINDLTVNCWIDKDFKLQSIEDLVEMLSKVNSSGANGGVLEAINEDIIFKLNEDRPIKIAEYNLRKYFEPFADKSKEQAIAIASTLDRNDNRRLLYENSSAIFKEAVYKNPTIGQMTYDAQKNIIDKLTEFYKREDLTPILDATIEE